MQVIDYIKETRGEMKHVNWPSRRQVAVFTATVIALSLITAAYVGAFDLAFSGLLRSAVGVDPAPVTLPADITGDRLQIGTEPVPPESPAPQSGTADDFNFSPIAP